MNRVFSRSMRFAPQLLVLAAAALVVQTFMPLLLSLANGIAHHARHLSAPFELTSFDLSAWLEALPQAAFEASIPLGIALLIVAIDRQISSLEAAR